MSERALEKSEPQVPAIVSSGRGLKLTNLDEMWKFSLAVVDAGMAPKNATRASVMLRIQAGAEAGLAPMQSIRGIMVVNNLPSIWGDVALGMIQSSGLLQYKDEFFEVNIGGVATRMECGELSPKDISSATAVCVLKRRGSPKEISRRYSWARAQKAGLTTKSGPWTNDPERMLSMRARAYAIRDEFADVLAGLGIVEEVQDFHVLEVDAPEEMPLASKIRDRQAAQTPAAIPEEEPENRDAETQKTEADSPSSYVVRDLLDRIEASETLDELKDLADEIAGYDLLEADLAKLRGPHHAKREKIRRSEEYPMSPKETEDDDN